ncbi:MAG: putative RNA-binding protein YlxR, DUF448 family [Chloroflexi bacterium]|jgi:predicted RNA-binding protein YlxR (DUF448 family)|nr:MAG: putative RNA-binding protein YlxR, DUF448 family [Chloroflexota bacterium]
MIRLAAVGSEVKLDLKTRLDGRGVYICISKSCRLAQLEVSKLSFSLKTIVTKQSTASITEQLRTLINE